MHIRSSRSANHLVRVSTGLLAALALAGVGTWASGGTSVVSADRPAGGEAADADRLVIASEVEPDSLDLGATPEVQIELWQILEPLIQLMPDGSFRPMLLEEVPDAPDPDDPISYTTTLREGLTYHDGTPVDAQSVVDWITYLAEGCCTGEVSNEAASVIPTAVDDRTIKFTLAAPGKPDIRMTLSRLLIAKPGTSDMGTNPIGTGAYRIVEWSRTNRTVLERFEDYWGEPAPFATVEIRYIPDAGARVAALSAGEVDLVPDLNAEDAAVVPEVITGPSTGWYTFVPDSLGKFENPDLRRALAMALDLDAIQTALFGGYATVPQCQAGTESYTGYNDNLERYPYDPEEARRLVQEAGAEGMTFEVVGSDNVAKIRDVAEAAVAMWAEIGLDPQLTIMPFDQFVPRIVDLESQPDMMLFRRGMDDLDYSGYRFVLFEPNNGIPANDDPRAQEVIEGADATADPEERTALLQEAAALACEEAYAIFAVNPHAVTGTSGGFSFDPSPYGPRFLRVADIEIG